MDRVSHLIRGKRKQREDEERDDYINRGFMERDKKIARKLWVKDALNNKVIPRAFSAAEQERYKYMTSYDYNPADASIEEYFSQPNQRKRRKPLVDDSGKEERFQNRKRIKGFRIEAADDAFLSKIEIEKLEEVEINSDLIRKHNKRIRDENIQIQRNRRKVKEAEDKIFADGREKLRLQKIEDDKKISERVYNEDRIKYKNLEKTLGFYIPKEVKAIDIIVSKNFTSSGQIFPTASRSLLQINQGTSYAERTGASIILKGFEIRLKVETQDLTSTLLTDVHVPCSRIMLIADTQPSKRPTVGDVVTGTGPYCFMNKENEDRFIVVFDKTYTHNHSTRVGITETTDTLSLIIPGTSYSDVKTVSQITTRTAMTINETIQENELITFSLANVLNSTDITTTNFFIVGFGDISPNGVSEEVVVRGRIRVNYIDV